MQLDPHFIEFIKGFVLPLGGVCLFLIQIGAQQRSMNKLLFGMIVRLVDKKVFDASDLLQMGVLDVAQQSTFTGGDLLKMISGVVK